MATLNISAQCGGTLEHKTITPGLRAPLTAPGKRVHVELVNYRLEPSGDCHSERRERVSMETERRRGAGV